MEYCIAMPSLLLSRFVKHYWTLENCLPGGQQHIQRIVPNGMTELMFYLSDRPVTDDAARSINENTVITGQLGSFYDIRVSGKLSLFSIIFKPQGLSMFFDIPVNELYNQNVPLKFIFKYDTDELETRLFEATTFTARIKIVERYLLKLLQKKGETYNYDRIGHSIQIINQSKGNVSIDHLASETCLGRKQFERVFTRYIGTTPKQFLKTIRFQYAVHTKSMDMSVNLTALTYSCGYYDQSHMISDFHKLTGMTPTQYFNECEPYSDYFQHL